MPREVLVIIWLVAAFAGILPAATSRLSTEFRKDGNEATGQKSGGGLGPKVKRSDLFADDELLDLRARARHHDGVWPGHHWHHHTPTGSKMTLSREDIDRIVADRFPPPPKVGVHPRIHTSPDELPALRQHLASSKMGQTAVKIFSEAIASRISSSQMNPLWTGLAAGNSSDAMEKALESGLGTSWANEISQTMGSAAFMYCAILQNNTGCKEAADVLTAVSYIYERKLAAVNPTADYQNDIMQLVGNDGFGIAYDYAYNSMSDSDQAQVRKTIVAATAGKKTCGVNKTAYTCNGNWNTFHLSLCTMVLAIEGEEGYDPNVLQQSITVMSNFLEYGLHASGAPFEPFGKGAIQSQHMHAMAKRGAAEKTVLHPNYVACIRDYYLHAMQPFGYGFAWFEEWGGTGLAGRVMDVILAKFALPDDKAIDFVWRNTIGDTYLDTIFPSDAAWSTFYGVIDWYSATVLSQDWTGPEDWDVAVAGLNAPLSYFCSERGMMMAHSHWAKNATWLEFNVRSDYWTGGHDHPDRGHFNFASHGRMWGIYPTIAGQSNTPPFLDGDGAQSRHKSVLLVDGLGHGGVVAPPGKVENYVDSDVATFTVANLTYAYTYSWFLDNWKDEQGNINCAHYIPAELENHTVNEFQLKPGPEVWKTTPIWKLYDGIRPLFDGDLPQNMCRTLYNPMKYFYRTAGLVRSSCNGSLRADYALIMDDALAEKAARVNVTKGGHAQLPVYEWLMQTSMDVVIAAYNGTDVILRSDNASDPARLLVRVVDISPTADDQKATVTAVSLQTFNQWTRSGFGMSQEARHEPLINQGGLGKRLVIATRTVNPMFKILLYPYNFGEELPITTFSRASNTTATLTVSTCHGEQIDKFDFTTDATTGRTGFALTRNGKHVIDV